MATDRIEHLRRLIEQYQKRLYVLELQQAMQGRDTMPQVLIEIEDVQAKITSIEQQLNVIATFSELEPKTELEIQLKNINAISPDRLDAALRAFAAVLNIDLRYEEVEDAFLSPLAEERWMSLKDKDKALLWLSLTKDEQRKLFERLPSRERVKLLDHLTSAEKKELEPKPSIKILRVVTG